MPELIPVYLTVEQWNVVGAVLSEAPAKLSRIPLNEIERQHTEYNQRKQQQGLQVVDGGKTADGVAG